ncbi:hypothetical protein TNCV_1956571 [Trichonephila clavipes]|nr:hypothetical protein TNCV_1956571 [Trichonephila clavipes]
MPPRRNKEKYQKLTEFEWGRIIGLREGGFSYRAIGARVKRDSSTVMRLEVVPFFQGHPGAVLLFLKLMPPNRQRPDRGPRNSSSQRAK